MIGHICEAAKENCYATLWSYGEICCHCGCCADDPEIRIPARKEYIHYELERLYRDLADKRFDEYQVKNIKSSIVSWRKELAELKRAWVRVEE